jgi:hypothetical protein
MKNFHTSHKEKPEHNQYWYSAHTIEAIIGEIKLLKPTIVACISTPSVFAYCLAHDIQCDLFDFDHELIKSISSEGINCRTWFYDFNHPDIPSLHHAKYDFVVCDPPFISSEVLDNYCRTIKQILAPNGRLLFTSIAENGPRLAALLGPEIKAVRFLPSIPALVYQYNIFVNYALQEGSPLAQKNDEVHSPD